MNTKTRRIAINVGSGFVPGMNAVAKGISLAAAELGWEVVGIRNGFAGLLDPDDHPDGGLLAVSPRMAENLDPAASAGVLGQSPQFDPFHRRQADEDGMLVEVDRSDEVLAEFTARNAQALETLTKEHGVELRAFPPDVLAQLQAASAEVVAELAAAGALQQRILASQATFTARVKAYHEITERAYLNARASGGGADGT